MYRSNKRERMLKFFKKIIFLLEKLSSKPRIDGLQVSDGSLEYVFLEEGVPHVAAVRVPPGVLENGIVKDSERFKEVLGRLHAMVMPQDPDRSAKVTLVLPEGLVYTQSFQIPNVGNEKIDEAILLNLQMISPMPIEEANMSAQIISETQDAYELLGAFAKRNEVNELHRLLTEAHFTALTFEFPALALARLIGRVVTRNAKSVLLLQISSDGLGVFILREKTLHFSYFRSWRSIQGEGASIPREVFDAAVIEETRKVQNFAVSKFGEDVSELWFIAPGFEKEIKALLEKNFTCGVIPFVLGAYPQATPLFYPALGAALRSTEGTPKTKFALINLGGEDLSKSLQEEQALNFIVLWRNIVVGSLGIVLIAFGISATFLVNQLKLVTQRADAFTPSTAGNTDYTALSGKVEEFNALVSQVEGVKKGETPWSALLSGLFMLMSQNHVIMQSIDIQSPYNPVRLTASTPDYQTVLAFKNALVGNKGFAGVDLPLTQITTQSDGSVSFNITFQFVKP